MGRTRRGGASMNYQQGQTPLSLGSVLGVKSYVNPAAMQAATALEKNPLLNWQKIMATGQLPVDKNKVANFAKAFSGQIVQVGPDGKQKVVLPTQEQGQQQLASFATAMGFAPQARQPVTKNWFGNPVYGNAAGYMGPMAGQPTMTYGNSGISLGLRGGLSRRRRRRVQRQKTRRS